MMGMTILGDSKMVGKIPQNHDFSIFGTFPKDLQGEMDGGGRCGGRVGVPQALSALRTRAERPPTPRKISQGRKNAESEAWNSCIALL